MTDRQLTSWEMGELLCVVSMALSRHLTSEQRDVAVETLRSYAGDKRNTGELGAAMLQVAERIALSRRRSRRPAKH